MGPWKLLEGWFVTSNIHQKKPINFVSFQENIHKERPKIRVWKSVSRKWLKAKWRKQEKRTIGSLHCPLQGLGLCWIRHNSIWVACGGRWRALIASAYIHQPNTWDNFPPNHNKWTWTCSSRIKMFTLALLLRSIPDPPILLKKGDES